VTPSWPPRVKKAIVYARRDRIMVLPIDISDQGIPLTSSVSAIVPVEAPPEVIGTAVLEAVAKAREGVHHPTREEWDERLVPLLAASGVSSWRAFARSSRSVTVLSDGRRLVFWPSKLVDDDAFAVIQDAGLGAPDDDLAAIGRAVLTAIELSSTGA
jgi:hypothetical protein